MAGVLLLILEATSLGTAAKFIPRPVVVGFTNGIAVIIASTQIKDFFGLKIDKVPGDFASAHFEPREQPFIVFAGGDLSRGLRLTVIILFMVFVKRVPGYIAALFLGTAVVVLFKLSVAPIDTRFGGIHSGFPILRIPHFRVDLLRTANFTGDHGCDAGCN
jgi:SulP family sulfate permease